MTDAIEKPEEGAKTFTQDEVNAIVSKRLTEDRAKSAADLAKREQDVTKRELRLTATEKLNEQGLPLDFLDMLDMSSEEAMTNGISLISKARTEQPAPAQKSTPAKISTGGEHNTAGAETDPIRKAMGLQKG